MENELILSKLKHEYEKIDIFDSYALINMVLPVPLQFSQGIYREIPCNTVPIWDINGGDKHVEEKSYPHLYPFGDGGEYAMRR